MTREDVDFISGMNMCDEISNEAYKKIMCHCEEQEPCEDEIILTKEEYGQLLSNEFDNGYAKGYREALEQEDSILDKIRADIENMEIVYDKSPNYEDDRTDEEKAVDWFNMDKFLLLQIIDEYKAGSEE